MVEKPKGFSVKNAFPELRWFYKAQAQIVHKYAQRFPQIDFGTDMCVVKNKFTTKDYKTT